MVEYPRRMAEFAQVLAEFVEQVTGATGTAARRAAAEKHQAHENEAAETVALGNQGLAALTVA
jgi:hypothetical protein